MSETDPEYAAKLKAIQALRERDIAASKAYDADGLLSLWTEDGVALSPGQKPVVGRAALAEGIRQAAAQGRNLEVLGYEEHFEETLILGGYAVEWGYISGAERPRAGGPVQRTRYQVMRVLKELPDGSWRVHRSMFHEAAPEE